MKRLLSVFKVALLASVVLFTSCGKEGDIGPKGDTGPAGPAGPAGPTGEPGTANVIYSDWLDASFKSDAGTYFATIDAAKLTSEILNQGDIRVFINISTADDPYITALPYTDGTRIVRFNASPGTIDLFSNIDASTTIDEKSGMKMNQYRYVIIPGGEAAKKAAIDWNDYSAVKAYLGLKD